MFFRGLLEQAGSEAAVAGIVGHSGEAWTAATS